LFNAKHQSVFSEESLIFGYWKTFRKVQACELKVLSYCTKALCALTSVSLQNHNIIQGGRELRMSLVQPHTQSRVSSLKALCKSGLENHQGQRLHKPSPLHCFHCRVFLSPLYAVRTSPVSIYSSSFSVSRLASWWRAM